MQSATILIRTVNQHNEKLIEQYSMKTRAILIFLMTMLIVNTFCQSTIIEMTFTAKNNEEYILLDSIFIENLTQIGDTTIYYPDTVLFLDYTTSDVESESKRGNILSISNNFPNPFIGITQVNLYLPENDHIRITVLNLVGTKVAEFENTLKQGNHSFTFHSNNNTYYLLTVTGKKTIKTIKMLNHNCNKTYGGKCKIVHNGVEGNQFEFKSQNGINEFVYNIGDNLKYTAYSDILNKSLIDSPLEDTTYTIQYSEGFPCSDTPTITDTDGNVYNTVYIGDQCWIKENLKTTTYRNGTSIPNVIDENNWSNLQTGAYAWYENDTSWKDLYGALYNWYAVMDTNGLCPLGWHVPSSTEWMILEEIIGGSSTPFGNELKACRQINSPLGGNCSTNEHPRWNEHSTHYGTDSWGFSALSGHSRQYDGTFWGIFGHGGFWWSSTETNSQISWYFALYHNIGSTSHGSNMKSRGHSIRCLKD